MPGLIGTVTTIKVPAFWIEMYHYAWFISFGISFVVYAAMMSLKGVEPVARSAAAG